MSDTIKTHSAASSNSSYEESDNVREKIVQILEELKESNDGQEQANTEFDKEIRTKNDCETELAHLRRLLQTADADYNSTANKTNDSPSDLTNLTGVSEVTQHASDNAASKLVNVGNKETELENELRTVLEFNIVRNKLLDDNINKLSELQQRMERAGRRFIAAEQRYHSLEQVVRQAYVDLKTLLQAKDKSRLREEKYIKDIEDLQLRLKNAEKRADDAESDVQKLQIKIDELQQKLLAERSKSSRIEKLIVTSTTKTN